VIAPHAPRPDTLVGRAGEVAELEVALDRLAAGGRWTIQIVGEPGIGKSRLLLELARRAEARGYLVLDGRAAEFERGLPFGVVVDSLNDYAGALPQSVLGALGEETVTELAALLPSLAAPAPAPPAPRLATERYRTRVARRLGGWRAADTARRRPRTPASQCRRLLTPVRSSTVARRSSPATRPETEPSTSGAALAGRLSCASSSSTSRGRPSRWSATWMSSSSAGSPAKRPVMALPGWTHATTGVGGHRPRRREDVDKIEEQPDRPDLVNSNWHPARGSAYGTVLEMPVVSVAFRLAAGLARLPERGSRAVPTRTS
jgi:AAA ATPase-like protein